VDFENHSQYGAYKKTRYVASATRLVMLKVAYQFAFGRTFSGKTKQLNNADNDSGVLKTGK
jgi:hypothetical protein